MNDKPKCPVFGCTIPRGIPHEHPAGVSAVMRDPAEPLNRDERAELEWLRAQSRHTEILAAGKARHESILAASNIQMAMMVEIMNAPLRQLADDIRGMDFGKELEQIPRRTLAQSVGKIMAWMFGIPALLLAAFAIGHYFGWWV